MQAGRQYLLFSDIPNNRIWKWEVSPRSVRRAVVGRFTGQEVFQNLAGRVGSGLESGGVRNITGRVGSDRVGPGQEVFKSCGSGRVTLSRPTP